MKKEIQHTVALQDDSTAKVAVIVPAADFTGYYDKGLSKIKEIAEVDGFRKGHAPESVILSQFGVMAILEEMADMAIKDTFSEVLVETKLDAIGRPDVSVTKLAKDNDFEYTISVAILPKLELPDYSKLAASVKSEKAVVEQKDIDEVLLELRKMRAHKELHQDGNEHKHGDEAHDAEHSAVDALDAASLPELTDEYVKELGEFATVADLQAKVTENLQLEKDQKAKEKRRNEILEKIVAETKGVLPQVLIDSESDRMLAQMKGDVAQMGGKFEDYLTYIKKTESDLRVEWRPDAEKRAKIQLILNQIATEKDIKADMEQVEKEAKRLMDMYSDADETTARDYMHQMLLNEAVLKSIEG
jgi:trigger factor